MLQIKVHQICIKPHKNLAFMRPARSCLYSRASGLYRRAFRDNYLILRTFINISHENKLMQILFFPVGFCGILWPHCIKFASAMATITKRGDSWFAQVRRKGHKSVSKSFPTKSLATEWTRKIEREIDAKQYQDNRSLHSITFGDLIDNYNKEIGATKRFGRNKVAVLAALKQSLGLVPLPALTGERLNVHTTARRAQGAGGVTIAIELTYIGAILKVANVLWKIPVSLEPVTTARMHLNYQGVSLRSKERNRRPTEDEINRICNFFDGKGERQRVPMSDIIRFAIATAMRQGEIIRLRWADLNKTDRTIIIRDRKHPTEKSGNDQEVPLLGEAFDIVERQPKIDKEERIFPVTEGTISTIFPRACRKLGIEDLRFHDFRHEGVSRLFEQGYSIEQVALVSGHRDWKMLARYTQIRAKDLHRDLTKKD